MRRVSKLWIAAVAGALMLGTMVGVVWARPGEKPLAAGATRKVTLAAADFATFSSSSSYYNYGCMVTCNSGSCNFVAPVVFPCLGSVTVDRIKLHVYDENPSWDASAGLYRLAPASAKLVWLGGAVSSGSSSAVPRTFTSARINKRVTPTQRAYVSLTILDSTNIDVYGVTIEYHTN